jgi:hypothetical protein
MDRRNAEHLLEGAELVPVAQAPTEEAKQLLDACLNADIPVVLGKDDHCVKGCAPKLLVLTRAEDAPRVVDLLRARWRDLLDREGTWQPPVAVEGAEGDALPCPACGTVVPADAAECPDCGLVV